MKDSIEGTFACMILPIQVVELRRSIQGQSYQKMILSQEVRPLLIYAITVRLDSVTNFNAKPCIFLLDCNYIPIKITCPLILNAQRLQPSPLCIFSFLSTK